MIDRRSSPTANLQSMTRAQSSPLCDCVCTVQYNQSLLMLSIHTCSHTYKGLAPAVLSALLCGSTLHTGMVEWVCISGQIGIYNTTKYMCVCASGGGGLLHAWSPPVITPSSGSRPLRTQVHSRGQRPENSLQIAFEVRKCILNSSSLLILPLFFISSSCLLILGTGSVDG